MTGFHSTKITKERRNSLLLVRKMKMKKKNKEKFGSKFLKRDGLRFVEVTNKLSKELVWKLLTTSMALLAWNSILTRWRRRENKRNYGICF
jgi:hypothetical protein